MLSIFRTNQIFTSILLIFYIIILWSSMFVVQHEWLLEATGIFSKNTFIWLGQHNWMSRALAFLLLLLNATLLNYIIAEHRMERETNLFPGIFYILISSSIPDFLHLSPILFANTFLILALLNLLKTYKNNHSATLIFNLGFWLAIASLFYFSFSIFVLWGLICLNVLRAFKFQEWLMVIAGFVVPYLLVGTYYFWFDQFGEFWTQQITENIAFLDFQGKSDLTTYVKIGGFSLLLLWVIGSVGSYNFKKNIQIQKKITVLYWLLFFAGVTTIFQSNLTIAHFQIVAIPAGVFLAMTFSNISNRWAESLHFLLVVIVLALHFKAILV